GAVIHAFEPFIAVGDGDRRGALHLPGERGGARTVLELLGVGEEPDDPGRSREVLPSLPGAAGEPCREDGTDGDPTQVSHDRTRAHQGLGVKRKPELALMPPAVLMFTGRAALPSGLSIQVVALFPVSQSFMEETTEGTMLA